MTSRMPKEGAGGREIRKQLESGSISDEAVLEYVSLVSCGNLLQFLRESVRDDRRVVAVTIAQPDRQIVHDLHVGSAALRLTNCIQSNNVFGMSKKPERTIP